MEEKPNKGSVKLIVITAILFVISLGIGIYGFYLDKFVDKEYEISYAYFVNGERTKNIPGEEAGYEFEKYKCNNGIKGRWDEDAWEFIPKAQSNGKCYLYFVDKKFKIELTPIDGVTIAGKSVVEVKEDEVAEFEVALSEGVAIKEIACTNNQEAKYEDSKITIENATDDTVCTIVTEDAKYEVEVKAINGRVTGHKKEVIYGEDVIYTVSPSNGYSLDSVECTNDQTGSYSNGKLTVSKVTNNTTCTVSFKSSQYTVKINVKNGLPSTQTKTITANGTVSFDVQSNSGTGAPKISCTNGQKGKYSTNSFVVSKVTANTVCTLTFN